MCGVRRCIDDLGVNRQDALNIVAGAVVLTVCEAPGLAYEGSANIRDAYTLGNARIASGALSRIFDDRTDMTDTIKPGVEEHWADECPGFAKKIAN